MHTFDISQMTEKGPGLNKNSLLFAHWWGEGGGGARLIQCSRQGSKQCKIT